MDDAVRDDIACLSASPYRGPLLACLADGPRTGRELRAETGASKATVSRALSAFDERGWTDRSGGRTTLTPLGHVVADAVAALTATMETATALRGVVDHLPLDELGFDLGRLSGAEVVTSSRSDPLAPIRHADRFLLDADEIRILSHSFSPGVITALNERVADDAALTMVIPDSVVEAVVAEDALREGVAALVAAAPDSVRVATEPVPHILAVADGTVSMGVVDDDGGLVAVVDTDDSTVGEWARSTVDAYAARAAPLPPDTLDG